MVGGILMDKKYLQENDLRIGMRCTPDQLSHIYDRYMLIVYDNKDDEDGVLVFAGKRQTKEYDKWFMRNVIITPIYHSRMELEENVVYDEELLCY